MSQLIHVRRPHVLFGPAEIPQDQADADYLRSAAGNIEFSRCLGSNLTATVTTLLKNAASAIEEQAPIPFDELPETLEERQALPARFHQPVFDDLISPKTWHCAVCWDDGLLTAWPCAAAMAGGVEVALAGGMQVSQ